METYLFHYFHREIVRKERDYLQAFRQLKAVTVNLDHQVLANQSLIEGIMASLIAALEAKDPYTRGHSSRVSEMSHRIARTMGLSAPMCESVRLAGLFHDIGKIGIADHILFHEGKLSERDLEEIRSHPLISVQILEPVDPLHTLLPGVKHHHENWDGTGYPDGLKGTEIPLAACIIRVADTYDAITSRRSYRNARDSGVALMEIERLGGIWFHPDVVRHVLDLASVPYASTI